MQELTARRVSGCNSKAEGLCDGVPYNTELANINGVSIHFWLGDKDASLLPGLIDTAQRHRDIVYATYSISDAPPAFWTHNDMVRHS
ncbi:hypothetical protein [Microvirga tunisiensis]|uniref:Uncharacterized protein n=1 Tax=Microvirga tunisiensis TaxID=2108360 RepID=A0A5N7MKW5_9HYPH|nr:hypothetical protein [Microvirga tunisiensis]MPR09279.1 hypothetical protein [Microvirga tunisiensis]MPR27488.1 hypothetical protein [Microvirga tunisiensis]